MELNEAITKRKREYVDLFLSKFFVIWDGDKYHVIRRVGEDNYKLVEFSDLDIVPDIFFKLNKVYESVGIDNGEDISDVYELFVIGTDKRLSQIVNKVYVASIFTSFDDVKNVNFNSYTIEQTGEISSSISNVYMLNLYNALNPKERYNTSKKRVSVVKPYMFMGSVMSTTPSRETVDRLTRDMNISGGLFSFANNVYIFELREKWSNVRYYFLPQISVLVHGFSIEIAPEPDFFLPMFFQHTLTGLLTEISMMTTLLSASENQCKYIHPIVYYSYYPHNNRLISLTFGDKSAYSITPSLLCIRNHFNIISNTFPVNPIIFYVYGINSVLTFDKRTPTVYLNSSKILSRTHIELDMSGLSFISSSAFVRSCLYRKQFIHSYIFPLIDETNLYNIFFQPNIIDYNPEVDIDLFASIEPVYGNLTPISFLFLENYIAQNRFSRYIGSNIIPRMLFHYIPRDKYRYVFKVFNLNISNQIDVKPIIYFSPNELERLETTINRYSIRNLNRINDFQTENNSIVYFDFIEGEVPYYVRTFLVGEDNDITKIEDIIFLTISYKDNVIKDKNLYFYAKNHSLHAIYLPDNLTKIVYSDIDKMYWFKHVDFMNSKLLRHKLLGKPIQGLKYVLRFYSAKLKDGTTPYDVKKLKEIELPSELNILSIPHSRISFIMENAVNETEIDKLYKIDILISNAIISISFIAKKKKDENGIYKTVNIELENHIQIKRNPYVKVKDSDEVENISVISVSNFEDFYINWNNSDIIFI
ncbi:MAG: hypothetical protein QXX12_01890 [Nanopusillaceae archaeon]